MFSAGTVSLVSLMVGSAINQVFSERGLEFCMDEDMGSALVDNDTNLTCGELKAEIAVSMAFTSGLMMVGVNLCCVMCGCEYIHIYVTYRTP